MSKPQPKKDEKQENYNPIIIKLNTWVEKSVRVRFVGGRQVTGVLQSADNVNNMLLDNTIEHLRDKEDPYLITNQTRELGLIFVRGHQVLTIALADGMEEVENPFAQAENQEE